MGRIEDINWLNETLDGYALEACRGRLTLKRGEDVVSELNGSHRLVNNVLYRLRNYGYGLKDLLLLAEEAHGEVRLRDYSMTIQRGDNEFTASLGQYGFNVYTHVNGEEYLCGSCPTSGALDILETFLAVSSKRAVRTKIMLVLDICVSTVWSRYIAKGVDSAYTRRVIHGGKPRAPLIF